MLSEKNLGGHVPYRDSKLTRLLKDSLCGNTITIMLACVSQFYLAYDETINTLKYAQRAKLIKSHVRANQVEATDENSAAIIHQQAAEISELKAKVKLLEERGYKIPTKDFSAEIQALQMQESELKMA